MRAEQRNTGASTDARNGPGSARFLGTQQPPRPARVLADRHYSRKTPGADQFTPPGRKLVLITPAEDAFWVTSYPFAEYVRHAWPGALLCSAFRNEGPTLSSDLVRAAVACTRWKWPEIPELGMVTFVDTAKVRKKRDFGRCFRKAGFTPAGYTKGGHFVLQLLPGDFPAAEAPATRQKTLPL